MQMPLQKMFEDFLNKASIFVDKKAITLQYIPHEIVHRDREIKTLAQIMAPVLKLEKPSNVFIYGKTGTGKTVVTKHVCSQLELVAQSKNLPVKYVYLNCKMRKVADTEYRLIAQLARELGQDIPVTGLPTDEVYNLFFKVIENKPQTVILVLDEIDRLIDKCGDDILYNLTRMNEQLKSNLIIIGISNDILFKNKLGARVISSLMGEELVFQPYDAIQLKDILKKRSEIAFCRGVIEDSVINKCAAYAAREHGDARRALNLLRVAGELAERENSTNVDEKFVDIAEEQIEKDKTKEVINKLPKQSLAVLFSVVQMFKNKTSKKYFYTGDIFDLYQNVCSKVDMRPLTQRRISDLIGELDSLGIINAKVISKGRYGRTREISMDTSDNSLDNMGALIKETLGV